MIILAAGNWQPFAIIAGAVLLVILSLWIFETLLPEPQAEDEPLDVPPADPYATIPIVNNPPSGDPIKDDWARRTGRRLTTEGKVIPLPGRAHADTIPKSQAELAALLSAKPPPEPVLPTETGHMRYHGGYYLDDPCTCEADCPDPCRGGCGCAACHSAYSDFLDTREE